MAWKDIFAVNNQLCPFCFEPISAPGRCPHCGHQAGEPRLSLQQLPPGTVLDGKYLLGMCLGQGGFGITYLAWDLNLRMKVAIKEYFPGGLVTRSSLMVSPSTQTSVGFFQKGVDAFIREARLLGRFQGHPNIVHISSFFRENNTAYFVMEYVEGRSLAAYLDEKGGRLSWEETTAVISPVMSALEVLHQNGILHRDIAPDNIYLTINGTVKLLDFGAAKNELGQHTHSSAAILKPGYAPLEQYSAEGNQGPWTDIYALAATIYRVLTGTLPPDAPDRLTGTALRPPSELGAKLPREAENALMKALAMDPGQRYRSMAEFGAGLERERRKTASELPAKPNAAPHRGGKRHKGKTFSWKKVLIPLLVVIAAAVITVPLAMSFFAYRNGLQAIADNDAERAADYEKQIMLFFKKPLNNAICEEGETRFDRRKYSSALEFFEQGRCEVDYCALGSQVLTDEGYSAAKKYYSNGDCREAVCTEAQYRMEDGPRIMKDMKCPAENQCAYAGNLYAAGSFTEALELMENQGCPVDFCALGDGIGDPKTALLFYEKGGCDARICAKADDLMLANDTTALDFYEAGSCDRSAAYEHGLALAEAGELKEAEAFFEAGFPASGFCDAADAVSAEKPELAKAMAQQAGCIKILQRSHPKKIISMNYSYITGIQADGRVIVSNGNTSNFRDWRDWQDVVSVDGGIGLKSDGTLVWTEEYSDLSDLLKLQDSVVEVSGSLIFHADGKLAYICRYSDNIFADENGRAVSISGSFALMEDGSVYSYEQKYNSAGGYKKSLRASGITKLFSSGMAGLNNAGNIEYWGPFKEGDAAMVQAWTSIVDMDGPGGSCGLTVGLKSDGTVVYQTASPELAQYDWYGYKRWGWESFGVCNRADYAELDDWTDIIAIAVYDDCAAGVRSDGRVLLAGDCPYSVSDWDLTD